VRSGRTRHGAAFRVSDKRCAGVCWDLTGSVDSAKGWQCQPSPSSQTKTWGPRARMLNLMRPMGVEVMATRRRLHVWNSCESVVRSLNGDEFLGNTCRTHETIWRWRYIFTDLAVAHSRFAEGPIFSNHARGGRDDAEIPACQKSWVPLS
jgi:hypothetical protein